MLNATRKDFGPFLIHSISHFSQNTAAIHLTLAQDPRIHREDFSTHGSKSHHSFYTWFPPDCHKAGTFCGWDRQADEPGFARSATRHMPGTAEAQLASFHSREWGRDRDGHCNKAKTGEGSKREPQQVARRDFHRRVKEELTTEPGLGVREMNYWGKRENPFTLIPTHAYKGCDNQEFQQAAASWLLGQTGQGSISNWSCCSELVFKELVTGAAIRICMLWKHDGSSCSCSLHCERRATNFTVHSHRRWNGWKTAASFPSCTLFLFPNQVHFKEKLFPSFTLEPSFTSSEQTSGMLRVTKVHFIRSSSFHFYVNTVSAALMMQLNSRFSKHYYIKSKLSFLDQHFLPWLSKSHQKWSSL